MEKMQNFFRAIDFLVCYAADVKTVYVYCTITSRMQIIRLHVKCFQHS